MLSLPSYETLLKEKIKQNLKETIVCLCFQPKHKETKTHYINSIILFLHRPEHKVVFEKISYAEAWIDGGAFNFY